MDEVKEVKNNKLKIVSLDEAFPNRKKIEKYKHNLSDIISQYPFKIILCAVSGGGKSTTLIQLLSLQQFLKGMFHQIYFFSINASFEEDNEIIKEANPKSKVEFFNGFTEFEETVKNIMNKQKELKDNNKKMKRILIICDDFITSKNAIATLDNIYIHLRKYNIGLICLSQNYRSNKSLHRNNATCLMIWSQSELEQKKIIEKQALSGYGKEFFNYVFDILAKNPFSFLCINRTKRAKDRFYLNFDYALTKNN